MDRDDGEGAVSGIILAIGNHPSWVILNAAFGY
jgi:hypothetical protein